MKREVQLNKEKDITNRYYFSKNFSQLGFINFELELKFLTFQWG